MKSEAFPIEVKDIIKTEFVVYGEDGFKDYFDTFSLQMENTDTRPVKITKLILEDANGVNNKQKDYSTEELNKLGIKSELHPGNKISFKLPNTVGSTYKTGLVTIYFETSHGHTNYGYCWVAKPGGYSSGSFIY